MIYNKPYTTVAEQVKLLKDRNLHIHNEDYAKYYLMRIGYYRLSGYFHPFYQSEVDQATKKLVLKNQFKNNADFKTVIDLYVFDKKLRFLILDALERIEVALRVDMIETFASKGAWAHLDANNFENDFAKKLKKTTFMSAHSEWVIKTNKSFLVSNEQFVIDFKENYSQTNLPLWMAAELWDFGMISTLYRGMTDKDKDKLALKYGIKSYSTFQGWLLSMNLVRNICAHHSRLWNKPLINYCTFPLKLNISDFSHVIEPTHNRRIYGTLLAMKYMLDRINPSSSWVQRLFDHIATFPTSQYIQLSHMGFPENWNELAIWQQVFPPSSEL